MHYSSGNYEAFVRPRKPEGADKKTAWFVGSGWRACRRRLPDPRRRRFRRRITILEELEIPGGALDGLDVPEKGFVIRGGREMEDHFECLWDLFRSIPSLEIEDASVLDEFYWLNKDDPNFSLQRATQNQGEDVPDKALFTLNDKAQKDSSRSSCHARGDGEQAHQRGLRRGLPRQQLLALLAHHVRLRGMAFGAGDEALPAPLHPPSAACRISRRSSSTATTSMNRWSCRW
jgi:hypothetical protein